MRITTGFRVGSRIQKDGQHLDVTRFTGLGLFARPREGRAIFIPRDEFPTWDFLKEFEITFCRQCRELKNAEEFSNARMLRTGQARRASRAYFCKSCENAYQRAIYAASPTRKAGRVEAVRRWQALHPERVKEINRDRKERLKLRRAVKLVYEAGRRH
jgi:hypothetical protein